MAADVPSLYPRIRLPTRKLRTLTAVAGVAKARLCTARAWEHLHLAAKTSVQGPVAVLIHLPFDPWAACAATLVITCARSDAMQPVDRPCCEGKQVLHSFLSTPSSAAGERHSVGGSLGNSSWGGGDFYGKCREILTEVEKHLGPNLVIFAAPVDATLYPEYHKIVKQPMDLGTIRGQLDRQQYTNPQEFCDVSDPFFPCMCSYNRMHYLVCQWQPGTWWN